MTQASLEAYIKGVESGSIDNAKADVFRYIKKNKNTLIIDLYNNMGISEHTISARVSDLLDAGYIKILGQKDGYSILSVVSDEKEREVLIHQRKQKRKEKAIKQLLKHDLEPETIEVLIKEINNGI